MLALMLVVPLGPMIYRLAYQPVAEASVLVLLIVSVAVHVTLIGIGLLFFGAEGSRTPAFTDVSFELGDTLLQGQTILVVVASVPTSPDRVARSAWVVARSLPRPLRCAKAECGRNR